MSGSTHHQGDPKFLGVLLGSRLGLHLGLISIVASHLGTTHPLTVACGVMFAVSALSMGLVAGSPSPPSRRLVLGEHLFHSAFLLETMFALFIVPTDYVNAGSALLAITMSVYSTYLMYTKGIPEEP